MHSDLHGPRSRRARTTVPAPRVLEAPPAGEGEPRPALPYRLGEFLDDQRRLLSEAAPGAAELPVSVDLLDGRGFVVRAGILRTLDAGRQAGLFAEKYGSRLGALWQSRFRLVLEFLTRCHAELLDAGLVDGERAMTVREEFLDYLLRDPEERRGKTTEGVIRGFLDQWSHRWI